MFRMCYIYSRSVSYLFIMSCYPTALRRVQISRGICTPEDQLDRFPAVDQSVSWISRASSVLPLILRSRISREIRTQGHNNLACWIINILLDVLLCSIAEIFCLLFVFCNDHKCPLMQ